MIRRILSVFLFSSALFLISAREIKKEIPPRPMVMPPISWLTPDIRLDLGDPAGTHNSFSPKMAVSGNSVYVVWVDTRNGGDEDIYFNRSLDRGASWMSSDVILETDPAANSGESFQPQIALSGNHVYVAWQDNRDGQYDIYFNHSTDRGSTWLTSEIRLDTIDSPGTSISVNPRICAQGANLYVVWEDYQNGSSDIYLARSEDYGVTWKGPFRLDGGTPGAHPSYYPEICCSGSHVYVTWQDQRDGREDIYFTHSPQYGKQWFAPVRLDTGDTAGTASSTNPMICCTGNSVYVVWEDYRTRPSGIYFNGSADNGATWMRSDVHVDVNNPQLPYYSSNPRICCSDSGVFVVWQAFDRLGPSRDNFDIFFNRSTDGGISWQSADTRLDTGDLPFSNSSQEPRICCSGNNVHVAWEEGRDGPLDIYFNTSADGGATWMPDHIRLDSGDPPGGGFSQNMDLHCTADNVFATWLDARNNGYEDIYFNTTQAPPRANAGPDGNSRVGESYSLDGRRSSDPDNDQLAYAWILRSSPAGSTAALSDRFHSTPSFVPDLEGDYVFQLNVSDPFGESDADRVVVTATALVDLTLSAGHGGTTLPAPGAYTYDKGESVLVIATADAGFIFSGWSGDAAGTDNPLSVRMDTDKAIHAGFEAVVYAPSNLTGERIENRSLSMAEYIARISWSAHPDNINITGYRITRLDGNKEVMLAVVGGSIFTYEDFGVSQSGALTYHVYAVRGDGYESDPAVVTIQ